MPTLTSQQLTALGLPHIMRRLFLLVEGRDLDTGLPDPVGFWDDAYDVEYQGQVYHKAGTLIQIDSLSARTDFSIPGLEITIAGIQLEARDAVRGRALDQAPISVRLAIYDVQSRAVIEPLIPHFRGFIDNVRIVTPEAGGDSEVVITCESTSRALTERRTAIRADATCRQRWATDAFYEYTGVQREKPLYFGRKAPKA